MGLFDIVGDIGKAFVSRGASLIPGVMGGKAPGPGQAPAFQVDNNAIQTRMKSLQDQSAALQAPDKLAAEGPSYQAKTLSGPLQEFDYSRQKANQAANISNDQNTDAINRKFASMGMGSSGAAVQAIQNQQNSNAQQRSDAMAGIDQQEAQTRRGLQQAEEGKAFQSSEAAKGRNLARDQFNSQIGSQFNQQRFENNSRLTQMDMGWQQAQQQAQNDQFNKELSQYQQQHSGGLLGAGGFLGTGIGA